MCLMLFIAVLQKKMYTTRYFVRRERSKAVLRKREEEEGRRVYPGTSLALNRLIQLLFQCVCIIFLSRDGDDVRQPYAYS